jgi:hypothetical protein
VSVKRYAVVHDYVSDEIEINSVARFNDRLPPIYRRRPPYRHHDKYYDDDGR